MPRITEPLERHHKVCDELFANAEAAALDNRWTEAAGLFERFRSDLESHFEAEETLLFPAFEAATGMSGGPTQVMRVEHRQIRDLLGDLARAVADRQADDFAGHGETLVILMQQHNLKEENILYPMCDSSLAANRDDLSGNLRKRIGVSAAA